MKNQYSVKDKLTLSLLTAGVGFFGVVLPDSLSDHNKLVHFSAHFGMSFLLALCFYLFCAVKWRIPKSLSYAILITATLIIGVTYKYWEIATQGLLKRFNFQMVMEITGVMTSMYQNLSGLLAAILLIEGLVDRNLNMSVMRSVDFYRGPGSVHSSHLKSMQPGIIKEHLHGINFTGGSQFSQEASENSFR